MARIRITESDIRMMVHEAVRKIVNENYIFPARNRRYSKSSGYLMVNGHDFVGKVLDNFVVDDKNVVAAMRDPMVREIAKNDYKVTAAWSHTNGSYDEPESDDFEIDDDEGLYETIGEIQDNNLRNAFFKGYDKYVESAEFDYDDGNYGPDPDIEHERRRDERGERGF